MHLPTDDSFSVPPMPEFCTALERGRVMALAAHPDDECAGPGGALGLHARQGDPVRVVVITDGRAGDPDGKYDAATYAARRERESREAMAHLGVDDFVFWGYPDSCQITDNDIEMIALRLIEQVEQWRPDIVYVPWEGEGNSDHRAVYCGAVRAFARIGFGGAVWGYETWNAMVPDRIVDITSIADQKRAALSTYESQLAYNDYLHSVFGLNAYRAVMYQRGSGYAEGYRAVRWGEG